MIADLRSLGDPREPLFAYCGDARRLPIPNGTVSAVVTSPPYMSRIDYVRATLPELACLGLDTEDSLSQLRRQVMGGVLSRGDASAETFATSALVRGVLDRIRVHDSKASAGYYLHLATQYFTDLQATIRELARVLAPGGQSLIVVQTSYHKDILVPLPQIVCELARSCGLDAYVRQTESVVSHIGQLSPHQRANVAGKTLLESVVAAAKAL